MQFRRFLPVGIVAAALAMNQVPAADGQDRVLSRLYGNGVHAYNEGNSRAAVDYLTAAVDNGATDPRVYYFLGLAKLRHGDAAGADAAFAEGARIEAQQDVYLDVGSALERVQGSVRMQIERHREQGRLAALERRERLRRQRYEELRDMESSVLFQDDSDLPASPPPGSVTPPAAQPAVPVTPPPAATQPDPFDAPAMDVPPADPNDPFGGLNPEDSEAAEDAGLPQAPMTNPDAPSAPGVSPPAVPDAFGPGDADADPFGDVAPQENDVAPPENADDDAEMADDPFGDIQLDVNP